MTNHEEHSERPLTYEEQGRAPSIGDRALVVKLISTAGFLIEQKHLDVRREGASGTVAGWVPGHGGDVWWVHHDESSEVGAYRLDEIAQISRIVSPEQSFDEE